MKGNKTFIIAALCLVGFCAITVVFNIFSLGELPASFIGAALGAVITGVVTVILLDGQSKAEEVKERNVKVFEQKSKIFQEYINQSWQVWADQMITADEFQSLTSDYYSKLMIYLKPASVDKISDCLAKIGDCIDKESLDDYMILRKNIIDIINTLSGEINLGGKIDPDNVEKLDSKMFPVLFKKTFIKEINRVLTEEEPGLLAEYRLKRAYSKQNEYLLFDFKKYNGCKIAIGPLDTLAPIKISLDITPTLHQFDKYRKTPKRDSNWIKNLRSDTGDWLLLNDPLPKDEDSDDNENEVKLGKINNFGFDKPESLIQFRGNFSRIVELMAQRAKYYLRATTIDKEFCIAEFPAKILGKGENIS
jgi:hypothetical protein